VAETIGGARGNSKNGGLRKASGEDNHAKVLNNYRLGLKRDSVGVGIGVAAEACFKK
jgi:hypothetical protein